MTQAGSNGGTNQDWQAIAGTLTIVLALGGGLLYAVTSVGYSRFYRALGVQPSDVGFDYVNTILSSVGLILWAAVFLAAPFAIEAFFALRRGSSTQMRLHLVLTATAILVGVLYIASLSTFISAPNRANFVKNGEPLLPIEMGPLVIFAVHAEPVVMKPVGQAENSPGSSAPASRSLLYLGQNDGTIVLYDYELHKAIYLPSSSVVLEISNCASKKSSDPLCKKVHPRRYRPQ